MNMQRLLLSALFISLATYAMEETEKNKNIDRWQNAKIVPLDPSVNFTKLNTKAVTTHCVLAQSPSGAALSVYNSSDGKHMYDLKSECLDNTVTLELSEDMVAIAGGSGIIEIWNLNNNKLLASLKDNPIGYNYNQLTLLSDTELLFTNGTTATFWDIKNNKKNQSITYPTQSHADFARIENVTVIDPEHCAITLYDPLDMNIIMQSTQRNTSSYTIPATESILGGYRPSNIQTDATKKHLIFEALNQIHVHDFNSGKQLRIIANGEGFEFKVIQALAGTTFATVSCAESMPAHVVKLYDINNGKITQQFEPVAINKNTGGGLGSWPYLQKVNEHTLRTIANYQTLQTWDTRTGKSLTSYTSQKSIRYAKLLDANHLFAQTFASFIIWNTDSGAIVREVDDNNSISIKLRNDPDIIFNENTILYGTPEDLTQNSDNSTVQLLQTQQ